MQGDAAELRWRIFSICLQFAHRAPLVYTYYIYILKIIKPLEEPVHSDAFSDCALVQQLL